MYFIEIEQTLVKIYTGRSRKDMPEMALRMGYMFSFSYG